MAGRTGHTIRERIPVGLNERVQPIGAVDRSPGLSHILPINAKNCGGNLEMALMFRQGLLNELGF